VLIIQQVKCKKNIDDAWMSYSDSNFEEI